jgi:SAM-dependent methyltransferase
MAEPVAIFEKEYYDRLKQIEGRHWWTLGMTDIMSRLLDGAASAGPLTFLDIGCGSGIGLAWAAKHLPQSRRLGIDMSEHAIAHCRGLGAELQLASADALPYPDASVDLAICIDVLQHLPTDGPALSEVRRVLKPGGRFYVRTNARSLTPPPPGSQLYTVAALQRSLGTAGLRIDACSRVNFVGSLVAEVGLLRRSLFARGHDHSHGHDHGHDHHGHDHAHGEDKERFKGGGYGGGLRLTAEKEVGLYSKMRRSLLKGEGALIARGLHLPFGHSIVALATRS